MTVHLLLHQHLLLHRLDGLLTGTKSGFTLVLSLLNGTLSELTSLVLGAIRR